MPVISSELFSLSTKMAYTVISTTQECNEDEATLREVDTMLKGI